MATMTGTSRIPTDNLTGSQITIEHDHHEVHEGNAFSGAFSRTTAATSGHRSGILFKTDATKICHLIASFAVSAGATFGIYEAPTVAANVGTHTPVPINRLRSSSNASTILNNATTPAANKYTTLDETQIAADGTFAVGTELRSGPLLVGSSPFAPGADTRGTREYVLKPSTKYLLLLTNTTATATIHWIFADWYEEA